MSSSIVDWNSQGSPSQKQDQNRTKIEYMKLKVGRNQFRPIGDPFPAWKYMAQLNQNDPKSWRSAVVSNESDPAAFDPRNCPVRQKINKDPQFIWVVNVIDREDNKLKILEMRPDVYNDIMNWANANGKNPSQQDGFDFIVDLSKKKTTKYEKNVYVTTCAGPTPLKQNEIDMISEVDQATGKRVGKLFDIKKLYKAKTSQEALAVFDGSANKTAQSNGNNWKSNNSGGGNYNNQNYNNQNNSSGGNNIYRDNSNNNRNNGSSNNSQINW